MRRLVPSTPGDLSVTLVRKQGKVVTPHKFAKFASVREVVNALIAEWDANDNPVTSVQISYTFPVERQ